MKLIKISCCMALLAIWPLTSPASGPQSEAEVEQWMAATLADPGLSVNFGRRAEQVRRWQGVSSVTQGGEEFNSVLARNFAVTSVQGVLELWPTGLPPVRQPCEKFREAFQNEFRNPTLLQAQTRDWILRAHCSKRPQRPRGI